MSKPATGTNGGGPVTGGATRAQRIAWLVAGAALFLLVQSIANVESTIDDMAKLGVQVSRAHVWVWQLSSVGVWLALAPLLWWLVAKARPPRFGWPLVAAIHAAATVPVSLIHIAAMVQIRRLVYAAWGEVYAFGGDTGVLLYEYRKDVATYLMIAAMLAFAQWLLSRPVSEPERPETIEVSDGGVTHRVPVSGIESASAAGNYVEIAWAGRTLLHRSTLAALEAALGPGFARIHRSRIVRRDAVRTIATDKSGDFTVTLESGATLRGSRRYREGL